jgi:NAD(P)-dependent dehydrogenase (short-subunit alcohol dehydrogenase family)
MLRGAVAATPAEVKLEARMKAMIPTGKLALPEEIADAVIWLASPRASYVIGAGITLDAAGGIWPANHHDIL